MQFLQSHLRLSFSIGDLSQARHKYLLNIGLWSYANVEAQTYEIIDDSFYRETKTKESEEVNQAG